MVGGHTDIALHIANAEPITDNIILHYFNMKCTCITVVLMHATVWNMHLHIHIHNMHLHVHGHTVTSV